MEVSSLWLDALWLVVYLLVDVMTSGQIDWY